VRVVSFLKKQKGFEEVFGQVDPISLFAKIGDDRKSMMILVSLLVL
jgi:hypothetical protein